MRTHAETQLLTTMTDVTHEREHEHTHEREREHTREKGHESESGHGPSRPSTDCISDKERLERYLRQRAAEGEFYFKSKFIASDVGLSPSQIGVLVGQLQESMADIQIEQWANTNATTWRIRPTRDTG